MPTDRVLEYLGTIGQGGGLVLFGIVVAALLCASLLVAVATRNRVTEGEIHFRMIGLSVKWKASAPEVDASAPRPSKKGRN
ncbi:hypothetical protein GCM10010468_69990 [Actinocorallia longicatena]|uniref:Uncharacterized protein n=1 Tax=Actinocorallia longicatena TaxID=111803 RepID=A0ABP6QMR0_9ACTN